MPKQDFGPFSFECPTAWSQRTILVFVGAASDGGAPPNLVVTHEARNADEELTTHAWRRVFELAKTRPDFELIGSRDSKIDGQPAFRAFIRWQSDRGRVTEALAWIDSRDGNALAFTCSAIEQPAVFDELERILASVRLGARDSMVAPSPTARASSPPSPPPEPEEPPTYAAIPMPGTRGTRR